MPSVKRPGNTVKCLPCKGQGWKEMWYTRVTTFIGAIESMEGLMKWDKRMVLLGLRDKPDLLADAAGLDPDDPDDKRALDRLAETARDIAGAGVKAKKGDDLHELSEAVDRGEELPDDVSLEDWADMEAYAEAKALFRPIHSEELMVNDVLKVAGTPDRIEETLTEMVAPDGTVIPVGAVLVTDLKTGSVAYGGLKMPMQLATYANSELNVAGSVERKPIEGLRRDWGVVKHVQSGSGTLALYWADLRRGWENVLLAGDVRKARSESRAGLTLIA